MCPCHSWGAQDQVFRMLVRLKSCQALAWDGGIAATAPINSMQLQIRRCYGVLLVTLPQGGTGMTVSDLESHQSAVRL